MTVLTQCALLACLAASSSAAGYGGYSGGGGFSGPCSNDGFYMNDETSIMVCSNGNSYKQHCAPGTKNGGNTHYSKKYTDFCDVNLNDYGYGASKHGYSQTFHSSSHGGDEYGAMVAHGVGGGHMVGYGGYGSSSGHQVKPHGGHGYQPLKPRQHFPVVYVPVYMVKH